MRPAALAELSRDGDEAACATSGPSDAAPPYGCGALIRIELVAVGSRRPAQPGCPDRFLWDGKQCVNQDRVPPGPGTMPSCTAGAPLDQGGCPPGPPACPKGTHDEGAGCAPDAESAGAMLRIPGASFRFGQQEHLLTIATFDLDVTEVTRAQFKACVDAGACVPPATREYGCNWGKDARGRHPINCVTWDEAKSYCAWAGKRLPTDFEWEFAAIGQTAWKNPWGNADPDKTRLCKVNEPELMTCPVGTFPAGQSRFGILDMSGNVSEWTLDAWCGGFGEGYSEGCDGSARVLRTGLPAIERVSRGGWDKGSTIGFRCARTVPPAPGPRVCPPGTIFAMDACIPEKGGARPPGLHHRDKGCVPDGSP